MYCIYFFDYTGRLATTSAIMHFMLFVFYNANYGWKYDRITKETKKSQNGLLDVKRACKAWGVYPKTMEYPLSCPACLYTCTREDLCNAADNEIKIELYFFCAKAQMDTIFSY